MSNNLYYLVKSGISRNLAESYIKQSLAVRAATIDYLKQFPGVTQFNEDPFTGKLRGIIFPNDIPVGFKKPNKHEISYPKKNSKWEKEMEELPACENPAYLIAKTFNIPLQIKFASKDNSKEWRGSECIGSSFFECGFLWTAGYKGDILLWIPDVQKYVVEAENCPYNQKRDIIVKEPAKSFVPVIAGAELISKDKWDLICLQHKINKQEQGENHE